MSNSYKFFKLIRFPINEGIDPLKKLKDKSLTTKVNENSVSNTHTLWLTARSN